MKLKDLSISLLAIVIFFSSCSKNESSAPVESPNSIGTKLLGAVMQYDNPEILKLAYSSLSDGDRFLLWKAKLSNASKDDSYSDIQKKLIQEINDKISIKNFMKSDEREVFNKVWLPAWITKNKSSFIGDELYNLLFTIQAVKSGELTISKSVSEVNCHCKLGSSWTCYQGSMYWSTCTKLNDCRELDRGCGALFDDRCDGNFCNPTG
jgi:hypothetical protein